MTYDLPDVITVEADGPVRIVRLNRPDQLNATNHELHRPGRGVPPARRRPRRRPLSSPATAGLLRRRRLRLHRRAHRRRRPARGELLDGRQIVTGMVACRVPVIAAVNGPAVGLGCSLVALSDIVFMAESAHLADPHVLIGLVAADGGPVTWPLLISLQLAKEYTLTGDRIPARACGRDRVGQPRVPRRRGARAGAGVRRARSPSSPQQATEDTKRILNLHLERAVLATLDFALTAEDRSFKCAELRANIDRLRPPEGLARILPFRGNRIRLISTTGDVEGVGGRDDRRADRSRPWSRTTTFPRAITYLRLSDRSIRHAPGRTNRIARRARVVVGRDRRARGLLDGEGERAPAVQRAGQR